MNEQELWYANARAIARRYRHHVEAAREADMDHRVAVARARDSALTPLESVHAAMALEEFMDSKAN